MIFIQGPFSETLKFHLIRNQLKANFIWSLNKLKGMKVYTNELGHMTSMAVMPIYGKKPVKMLFSKIDGSILLKLDKNKRLSIKRQKMSALNRYI